MHVWRWQDESGVYNKSQNQHSTEGHCLRDSLCYRSHRPENGRHHEQDDEVDQEKDEELRGLISKSSQEIQDDVKSDGNAELYWYVGNDTCNSFGRGMIAKIMLILLEIENVLRRENHHRVTL